MLEQLKSSKIILWSIIIALVIALGFFYILTLNNFQKEISGLQNYYLEKIYLLTLERNDLIKENQDLENKIKSLKETSKQPEEEKHIEVINPNGGETFCIGEETKIEWKSKGIDTVSIRVVETRGNGKYYHYIGMDSLPATYNETDISGEGTVNWKIEDIPEGYYKLEIFMNDLSDMSDTPFSIIKCQG